jgi:hypothetical protein
MKSRSLHAFMGEEVEDIRRVLTIAFRGTDGLSPQDFERTLSFDMEWVAPHEAEAAVKALHRAGWLKEVEGLLVPAVSVRDVAVPFGWFPRPSRLLQPVPASQATLPPKPASTDAKPASNPGDDKEGRETTPAPVPTRDTDDPRARLLQRVIGYVARQSGLEREELRRRAERKQAAFDLITPWLAYALVAREQGLEMNGIVDALAVV